MSDSIFDNVDLGYSVANDATHYTLGMQFHPTEDVKLVGIRFYSPSGADLLPAGTAIFDVSSQTVVAGTENDSPTWSGSAGSGWVEVTYDGSVTLTSGTNYKVVVDKDNSALVYGALAHYWDGSGAGASGITSAGGLLVAPNSATVGGQDSFISAPWPTYPTTAFNAGNYGLDVVVVASTGVTGTGNITASKATADGSGITFAGSGNVAVLKSALSGSGLAGAIGSGAVMAPKPVAAGSGTPTFTGSGNASVAKSALAGTGSAPLAVTGSGDARAKKAATAGVGSEKFTGSGGIAASKARVDATGSFGSKVGSGGLTAKKPAAASNGAEAYIAVGGLTLKKFTVLGEGTLDISGSGSIQAKRIEFTGISQIFGSSSVSGRSSARGKLTGGTTNTTRVSGRA